MALRPTRTNENSREGRYARSGVAVDEIDAALEQLSPLASLIRNARLNQ